MSGRAFKKAINREYELSAMQIKDEESNDSEGIEPKQPPQKKNLFDLVSKICTFQIS